MFGGSRRNEPDVRPTYDVFWLYRNPKKLVLAFLIVFPTIIVVRIATDLLTSGMHKDVAMLINAVTFAIAFFASLWLAIRLLARNEDAP